MALTDSEVKSAKPEAKPHKPLTDAGVESAEPKEPRKPLTDAKVKSAEPKAKPHKLYDTGGMFLLVHPNASKYWRLKYRIAGKEKVLALGVYPDVSLKLARKKRDDARKLIADGIDPVFTKREKKRDAAARASNSFEAIAREWHDKAKGKWDPDHATMILRSLEANVFPDLGARPVAEIGPLEILAVLRKVEARSALNMLSRVRQRMSKVFRYAIANQLVKSNPVSDVERDAFESRNAVNRSYIKREELPTFLKKLEHYDGQPLTRLGLKLALLTWLRSSELRGGRWSEINFDRAEWRVPAERMKMKEQHLVPLSRQAIAVLQEIRQYAHGDLVFPSQKGGGQIMSENTLLGALYRMGYHSRATVHGFRSTASTILHELGFESKHIEVQLAHRERNKVTAAYNHAEYLDKRRALMQSWADFIDAEAADKIVPIRRKG